jgi:hypothetical protein
VRSRGLLTAYSVEKRPKAHFPRNLGVPETIALGAIADPGAI